MFYMYPVLIVDPISLFSQQKTFIFVHVACLQRDLRTYIVTHCSPLRHSRWSKTFTLHGLIFSLFLFIFFSQLVLPPYPPFKLSALVPLQWWEVVPLPLPTESTPTVVWPRHWQSRHWQLNLQSRDAFLPLTHPHKWADCSLVSSPPPTLSLIPGHDNSRDGPWTRLWTDYIKS